MAQGDLVGHVHAFTQLVAVGLFGQQKQLIHHGKVTMPRSTHSDVLTIWVGARAVDMVPFDKIVPIDAIVTCDYGSDVQQLEEHKTVFSLEKLSQVKHIWANFHLNYLFLGEMYNLLLPYLSAQDRMVQFLCYSASGSLDQMLIHEGLNIRNLSIPLQQRLYFDDKVLLQYRLQKLGINTLPTMTVRLGRLRFAELSQTLGTQLVVKLPVGSAGGKVYYVEDQASFDAIQQRHYSETVLVQEFRKGAPICVHGVITGEEIVISPASMQVIGPKECSRNRFEWCGNDFHVQDHVPPDLLKKAADLVTVVGQSIKEEGYRGVFGIDLLIDAFEGEAYVLEINPRFQGSTALLTQLELLNGISSHLIEHHFSAFGGMLPISTSDSKPHPAQFDRVASQVIMHCKADRPMQVKKAPRAGIYTCGENGSLVWVREGLSLSECKDKREFVLAGGVPVIGEIIIPGAPMLWIQSFNKALNEPTNSTLTEEYVQISSLVEHELELTEVGV